MTPKKAMTQLVEAALDNDAQGVYALLHSDEPIEMPSIALCRAIAAGSADAALALAGEGVSLVAYPRPIVIAGDTLEEKRKRVRYYFTRLLNLRINEIRYAEPVDEDDEEDVALPKAPAPGCEQNGFLYIHATSLGCAPAVEALVNAGLLSARDRAGLLLMASYHWAYLASKRHFELAVYLAKTFDGNPPYPMIDFTSSGLSKFAISDPADCVLLNDTSEMTESLRRLSQIAVKGGIALSYAHLAAALTDRERHQGYETALRRAVNKVGLEAFGGGPLPKRPRL